MKNRIVQLLPLVLLLLFWELFPSSKLFSSPSKIIKMFFDKIIHGDIVYHFCVTGFEALSGLLLGLIIGSIVGFLLVYSESFSRIGRPYLFALSSIPTFALAPLMIIWFGTDIFMKVVLAFLATVFTTMFQVYEGANKVPSADLVFFRLNGAKKNQIFWLLSFPASLDWIIQSLKLNAGFSVLGAFIGEFISAEKGLGFIITKESGVYNTTYVFVAIICIVILSLIFSLIAKLINIYKIEIIRWATKIFADFGSLGSYKYENVSASLSENAKENE